MSRAEIGVSRARLSRDWNEDEVKKRHHEKNRWREEERERKGNRTDGTKAGRERKEKGGTLRER